MPSRPPARLALPLVLALLGALLPVRALAASCCGGGGGGAAVVPRATLGLADLSFELERYQGFWDANGIRKPDPAGSDLRQYRATLAAGARVAADWQVGAALPWVWNSNVYSGVASHTQGMGDASVAVWYEALTERTAWKASALADLVPSVTVGAALTLPTGKSPYDDVPSSFDVTGRGFYRLDGNVLVEKGYRALSATLSASYGKHLERSVNRLYGRWVEPYRKNMGDRASASAGLAYRHFVGLRGHSLTLSGTFAWLHEDRGTLDGRPDTATGMAKTSFAAGLSWSSTDEDLSARLGWSHAFQRDGWGTNFPVTDVFSLGVRRVFR